MPCYRNAFPLLVASSVCVLGLSACGGGGSSSGGDSGTATNTAGSNGCDDRGSVFATAGNTLQKDYVTYAADESTVLQSWQKKTSVKEGANFRGESNLLEIATTGSVTFSSAPANGSDAGQTYPLYDSQQYVKRTATEEVAYGDVVTRADGPVTSYYTAPLALPLVPETNKVYTSTFTITTEATSTQPQLVASYQLDTTFLGVENVTVLAGTFPACKVKFQTTVNGTPGTRYEWVVASGRYKGFAVKKADANGKKTEEAKVLLVNGV